MKRTDPTDTPTCEVRRPVYWKPVVVLMIVLLGWSVLIGIGALLNSTPDIRKFLVISGTMAGFLSLWLLAIWRWTRKRQELSDG